MFEIFLLPLHIYFDSYFIKFIVYLSINSSNIFVSYHSLSLFIYQSMISGTLRTLISKEMFKERHHISNEWLPSPLPRHTPTRTESRS